MSINQYTSDTPETTSLWWSTQQQQASNPSSAPPPIPIHQWHPQLYPQQPPTWQRFNLNNIQDEDIEDDDVAEEQGCGSSTRSSSPQGGGGEGEEEEQREAMFEKPLTPSDVGKLNRLVIPKQHAEKYFPLDSSSGETKGLLLSFEDESGKCWRFRYSYWNSSQSYVLTKGWSRYVKDKRLHAGDVVLFHRHRTHAHRFFITWRRRQHTPSTAHLSTTGSFYPAHPYPAHHLPFPYQTDYSLHHTGGGSQSLGQNSQTTPGGNSSSSSSSRVLRLFGVNMECQPDDNNNNNNDNNDSQTSFAQDCPYNIMSSPQGTATQQFHRHQPPYSSPNTHPHMDVNQMRNRRGQGQVDATSQN